jgi:hypothetical protein
LSKNIVIFFKDGQDEFLKTEYLIPCFLQKNYEIKLIKKNFREIQKESRIKYISIGSAKNKFIFIFQKLIANSVGDLNLQLLF